LLCTEMVYMCDVFVFVLVNIFRFNFEYHTCIKDKLILLVDILDVTVQVGLHVLLYYWLLDT